WAVAMTTLAHERGTLALNLAMELDMVVDQVVELARVRMPALDPARRAVLRQRIAELSIEARPFRLNGYRALRNMVRSEDPGRASRGGRVGRSDAPDIPPQFWIVGCFPFPLRAPNRARRDGVARSRTRSSIHSRRAAAGRGRTPAWPYRWRSILRSMLLVEGE